MFFCSSANKTGGAEEQPKCVALKLPASLRVLAMHLDSFGQFSCVPAFAMVLSYHTSRLVWYRSLSHVTSQSGVAFFLRDITLSESQQRVENSKLMQIQKVSSLVR